MHCRIVQEKGILSAATAGLTEKQQARIRVATEALAAARRLKLDGKDSGDAQSKEYGQVAASVTALQSTAVSLELDDKKTILGIDTAKSKVQDTRAKTGQEITALPAKADSADAAIASLTEMKARKLKGETAQAASVKVSEADAVTPISPASAEGSKEMLAGGNQQANSQNHQVLTDKASAATEKNSNINPVSEKISKISEGQKSARLEGLKEKAKNSLASNANAVQASTSRVAAKQKELKELSGGKNSPVSSLMQR